MTNALKAPVAGTDPLATDVSQLANLFNAMLDAGVLTLAGAQSTPSAPSASASGTAGNLNGSYMWKVVLITGWKQGDGSYYVSGFAPSSDSASATITNNSANLTGIATGTNVVIGRAIYRTEAGGAAGTEKFVGVIWDNTTTTWTDNIADANLGTGMPTSSSNPAVYGTAIPANVPTTNTTGTSLSAVLNATGGNVLRTDSGAPNPQTVVNKVRLGLFSSANAVEYDIYLDSNAAGSGTNAQNYYWARVPQSAWGPTPKADFGLVVYDGTSYKFPIAFDYTDKIVGIAGDNGWQLKSSHNTLDDGSGNMTVTGNLTVNGTFPSISASGIWTPASGTFNVPAGTVINIASVPMNANTVFAVYNYPSGNAWYHGTTNSSFVAWMNSQNGVGYSNGISSTGVYSTSDLLGLYDGTYYTQGYLQINNGYLQFFSVTSSGSYSGGQSTVRWGVS